MRVKRRNGRSIAFAIVVVAGAIVATSALASAQTADPTTTTSSTAAPGGSTVGAIRSLRTAPKQMVAPGDVNAQVISGHDVSTATYPWMAAILDTNTDPDLAQFCAGELIDPSWILTAATCMSGATTSNTTVVLGHTDLSSILPADRRAISQIIPHPAFGIQGPNNVPVHDAALLQLTTPATGIPTLAYDAVQESDTTSAPAQILGWGAVDYDPNTGPPPDYFYVDGLQGGQVNVLRNAGTCGNYPAGNFTSSNMLCGGGGNGFPSVPVDCALDSGGPIVLGGPGGFRLIGIASWGDAYCAENPTVFTTVSELSMLTFIQSHLVDGGSVGTYNPITPVRILDTRAGGVNTGNLMTTPVAPGQTVYPQVTGMGGVGGVPLTGASSVVLNVTATGPTSAGWLTLFPAGTALPTASNLNFSPGQTVPNFVTVKLGQGGKVAVSNTGAGIDVPGGGAGTVNVIIDVVGWYTADNTAAFFHPMAPNRLVDTRFGTDSNPTIVGAIAPQAKIVPKVRGGSGSLDTLVDPTASAVVLNVTASVPSAAGWLTVYPSGNTPPTASNLNFVAGQTVPNLVTVKVDTGDDSIRIQNTFGAPSAGTVQVIVDVVGWYGPTGVQGTGGTQFHAMTPARLMDNRGGTFSSTTPNPTFNTAIGPQATINPVVRNVVGVPITATAVALNATVTGPAAQGWLTLFPDAATTPPTASNLNFLAGQTVPNAAIVQVGPTGGTIGVSNTFPNPNAGSTFAILDVNGWFE